MIKEQGEDAECAAWIYTKNDCHLKDEDGNTDSASPQPSQRDRDKQTKSLTFRQRLKASRAQFMRWVDN